MIVTPDEIASAIATGIAAGNTVNNNLLFALVIMAFILTVVVVFQLVRSNATLASFLMGITGRSVEANEQSGRVGLANTDALIRQTKTLDTHSGTLDNIDVNVKTALAVLDVLGLDVDTLAKHASKPTAATQDKVDQLADKADQKSPAPVDEQPAANAELPPNTVEVTLPVKLVEKEKPA